MISVFLVCTWDRMRAMYDSGNVLGRRVLLRPTEEGKRARCYQQGDELFHLNNSGRGREQHLFKVQGSAAVYFTGLPSRRDQWPQFCWRPSTTHFSSIPPIDPHARSLAVRIDVEAPNKSYGSGALTC
jgi:hypothetical protein